MEIDILFLLPKVLSDLLNSITSLGDSNGRRKGTKGGNMWGVMGGTVHCCHKVHLRNITGTEKSQPVSLRGSLCLE